MSQSPVTIPKSAAERHQLVHDRENVVRSAPGEHQPKLITSHTVTGEGILNKIADVVNKLIGSMFLFVGITIGIVVWLFAGNIVGFDKTPWPLLLTLLNLPQLSIMISLQVSANRAQTASDARAMAEGLRALRVPYPIVFVLVTGTRFIPVASADLADLTDAARLRGMTVSGTLRRRLADWSTLLVPLLVLTIHRGLQLGEAMEARGFSDGRRRASLVQLRWRVRDSIVVAIAGAGFAAVLALRLISG